MGAFASRTQLHETQTRQTQVLCAYVCGAHDGSPACRAPVQVSATQQSAAMPLSHTRPRQAAINAGHTDVVYKVDSHTCNAMCLPVHKRDLLPAVLSGDQTATHHICLRASTRREKDVSVGVLTCACRQGPECTSLPGPRYMHQLSVGHYGITTV